MAITEQILNEHIGGESVRQLASRHRVSKTAIHAAIRQATTDVTMRILVDLYRSAESGEDEIATWVVPNQQADLRAAGIRIADCIRDDLRGMGVPVRVSVRHVPPGTLDLDGQPSPGGTVFAFLLDPETNPVDAAEEE